LSTDHPREKREHVRVPVSLSVQCEPSGAERFAGEMTDLSLCGARMASARMVPVGTSLVIVAQLPSAPEASRLPATVRWTEGESFGVQFGLLGARDTRIIAELMARGMRERWQTSR
jgi:hypothetical protein